MNDPEDDLVPRRSLPRPTIAELTRRIEELERYTRTHGESLSRIVGWFTTRPLGDNGKPNNPELKELRHAIEEAEDKALELRLQAIEKDVATIQNIGARLLWIVAGIVVGAAVLGVALILVYGIDALKPGIP